MLVQCVAIGMIFNSSTKLDWYRQQFKLNNRYEANCLLLYYNISYQEIESLKNHSSQLLKIYNGKYTNKSLKIDVWLFKGQLKINMHIYDMLNAICILTLLCTKPTLSLILNALERTNFCPNSQCPRSKPLVFGLFWSGFEYTTSWTWNASSRPPTRFNFFT